MCAFWHHMLLWEETDPALLDRHCQGYVAGMGSKSRTDRKQTGSRGFLPASIQLHEGSGCLGSGGDQKWRVSRRSGYPRAVCMIRSPLRVRDSEPGTVLERGRDSLGGVENGDETSMPATQKVPPNFPST